MSRCFFAFVLDDGCDCFRVVCLVFEGMSHFVVEDIDGCVVIVDV